MGFWKKIKHGLHKFEKHILRPIIKAVEVIIVAVAVEYAREKIDGYVKGDNQNNAPTSATVSRSLKKDNTSNKKKHAKMEMSPNKGLKKEDEPYLFINANPLGVMYNDLLDACITNDGDTYWNPENAQGALTNKMQNDQIRNIFIPKELELVSLFRDNVKIPAEELTNNIMSHLNMGYSQASSLLVN